MFFCIFLFLFLQKPSVLFCFVLFLHLNHMEHVPLSHHYYLLEQNDCMLT